MEDLLVGDSWFRLIATGSLYESEFEALIMRYTERLFPGYRAVGFKVTVSTDQASHRPDFALVDAEYRDWWVVEVERVDHDLHGHVIPQVHCFASGTYDHHHARALSRADDALDEARLLEMLKGDPPGVLVVADRFLPSWESSIRANGGLLMAVPVFRSAKNHLVLGVVGGLPERSAELITKCHRDRLLKTFLRVASPASLPIAAGEEREILFRNGVTRWHRLDMKGQVYLAPVGANPLPVEGGAFVLKQIGEELSLEVE